MAADETVTWGEVCKSVSYRDGLYRVCKDKVPDFNGFQGSPMPTSDTSAAAPDFSAQLARSARPIPPPPPAGWEPPDEPGFVQQMFGEMNLERLAVYGILGAVIWYFFLRKEGSETEAAKPATTAVTSPKAA